jgi:hypothetical protein
MTLSEEPTFTQTFVFTIASDGDVSADEIKSLLEAVRYHRVEVFTCSPDHEHPCPTTLGCISALRREGLDIPDGVSCCVCWVRQNAADR